jgi:HEAT repeat protein
VLPKAPIPSRESVPAQTSGTAPARVEKHDAPGQLSREARATELRAAEEKLSSHDPAAIRKALDALAQLGGDAASAAVVARVRRGMPPQLTEQAIETLVKIDKPNAGPVLLELTQHRRAAIRQRAVSALGALKIRSAQSALFYALDDPNPEVRGAAAKALAGVGTARALPVLWTAAERGVDHALEAIGAIASPRDLKAVFEHVSNNDVTLVVPALQAMLDRETFPLAGKLTIAHEVEKLGSASARMYLVRWLDTWKQSGHPRLRQALFDAIKHIDDAQKLVSAEAANPSAAAKPALTPRPAASAAKGAHP